MSISIRKRICRSSIGKNIKIDHIRWGRGSGHTGTSQLWAWLAGPFRRADWQDLPTLKCARPVKQQPRFYTPIPQEVYIYIYMAEGRPA